MSWLHTWLGIAFSGILFAAFWTGTLTIFDYEIDQWMAPEYRVMTLIDGPVDPIILPILRQGDLSNQARVVIVRPTPRKPLMRVITIDRGSAVNTYYNPLTGQAVELTDTLGGRSFFYPFHHGLHLHWRRIGDWIVALASMGMLALIFSGLFIHRKIIKDFFTFRPRKAARRSLLDLHNLTAMVALPSHILFPLSGILIFAHVYFPQTQTATFKNDRAAYEQATGFMRPDASGTPGAVPQSVDAYITEAEAIWTRRDNKPAVVDEVNIFNVGDAQSLVRVRQRFPRHQVAEGLGVINFDPQTDQIVSKFDPGPFKKSVSWLHGAHVMQFENTAVRWLFFASGLAGSAMIATGLLFWIEARVRKGRNPVNVRIVRALTIGAVTGLIGASGAFLVVNRLLPADAAAFGLGRASLEAATFYGVWIAAVVHGAIRDKAAWAEQCWVIAMLGVAAAILNWVTTGDHIIRSLTTPHLLPIAGMDLVLLLMAGTAAWAALRLGHNSGPKARISAPGGSAVTRAGSK